VPSLEVEGDAGLQVGCWGGAGGGLRVVCLVCGGAGVCGRGVMPPGGQWDRGGWRLRQRH
jgi:hypothetical protein